jgi:hypothetical protein
VVGSFNVGDIIAEESPPVNGRVWMAAILNMDLLFTGNGATSRKRTDLDPSCRQRFPCEALVALWSRKLTARGAKSAKLSSISFAFLAFFGAQIAAHTCWGHYLQAFRVKVDRPTPFCFILRIPVWMGSSSEYRRTLISRRPTCPWASDMQASQGYPPSNSPQFGRQRQAG